MRKFTDLTLIQQKRYLELSKGITINFPSDFTYEDTPEGHSYWWRVIFGTTEEVKYLR